MIKAILFANQPTDSEFDPIFGKVYGMTVIERTLHALERAEVLTVTIIGGANKDRIEQLLESKKPEKLTVNVLDRLFAVEAETVFLKQAMVIQPDVIKTVIAKQARTSDNNVIFHQNPVPQLNLTAIFHQNDAIDVIDVSKSICTPIQTKEQLKRTKKALIKSLIKPTDGWVSRHLNRPISTNISRILAHTPITPNQFTLLTGLIGVATGYFMAMGGYWNWLIGAFLFHATSVLDGVDGELARLKFKSSPFGQWLDTLVDNSSYVIGLGGLIVGVARNGWTPATKIAGIAAVVFALLALGSLYFYLMRYGKGGTLLNVEYSFQEGNSTFDKVMRVMAAFGKRDLFALLFLGLAIIGQLPMALAYVAIMAAGVFGFSLQAHASAMKKM